MWAEMRSESASTSLTEFTANIPNFTQRRVQATKISTEITVVLCAGDVSRMCSRARVSNDFFLAMVHDAFSFQTLHSQFLTINVDNLPFVCV